MLEETHENKKIKNTSHKSRDIKQFNPMSNLKFNANLAKQIFNERNMRAGSYTPMDSICMPYE